MHIYTKNANPNIDLRSFFINQRPQNNKTMLIRHKALELGNGIIAFTTTRNGGVSIDEKYKSLNLGTYTNDRIEYIIENKRRLCDELSISERSMYNAHQIHGDKIIDINNEIVSMTDDEKRSKLDGCDAMITNIKGICITVTTADCVPVLIYEKNNHVAAAIHSGWRGTLKNIAEKTITKMKDKYDCSVHDMKAVIGPCISGKNYQIGNDIKDIFTSADKEYGKFFINDKNKGKSRMEIRRIVEFQLKSCGIKDIDVSKHCTFEEENLFFSARRQGNDSGRMLTGIII